MKLENYIKEGPNHITIYYAAGNNLMIRSGGTWTWRNNNPGNMRKGAYSEKNGRIGFSGGFAVFPTVEQGEIALRDLLKNGYQHSSLQGMVKAYAPPKDKNKKMIVAYYVAKLGWVLKEQAIELSKNYKIDAVVAISRSGSLYLRTRPDIEITNNLDLLG